METKRQQKYGRLIQKELGAMFQRYASEWFGGAFVTVTEVKPTPDLKTVRVYLSIMMAKDKDAVVKQAQRQYPQIRRELGTRIRNQVRAIPELQFFLDDTFDEAEKIHNLLNKLDIPPTEGDKEK